jgi:signal transduction histidine kinase
MRLRIVLLVVAAGSLVLFSFLIPLALVLRTQAADRAVNSATAQAESLAPSVAGLQPGSLQPGILQAIARASDRNKATPLSVFLPGRPALGVTMPLSAEVRQARRGHSFNTAVPGGVDVLVAVPEPSGNAAVIQVFVPESQLHRGVTRTWLVLLGLGLVVLMLSVALADVLARSLVRPLAAVARAADRLAAGDLSARAGDSGPPEVRRVGAGLNRLARRIGELLAYERETIADVSHRLRTPMTALQIDAESLRDHFERAQMLSDIDALERTVDEIIREARRPARIGLVTCDAVAVVAERTAFWRPLAEDTERAMTVELADGELPVRVTADDLGACMDVLLENVFAHTPDGAALAIRLSRRAAGGAWLVVADDGPGFRGADPTERGKSLGGSTGLGLDIVRRIAEASGGTLTLGRSASGGGAVTVGLGAATRPVERMRGHRRTRSGAPDHPQGSSEPASYFWQEGE